jgi:hypothetical protein
MKANQIQTRADAGGVLVAIIIGLLGATVLGAGALTMATSARYERVTAGLSARAFYLAESGGSYVKAVRRANPNALPNGTFTLANGDQFVISTATNGSLLLVQSTGVVNPNSRIETRRRITVELLPNVAGGPLPVGFDLNDDGGFDSENWGAVGVDPTIRDTGPSGGQPALDLRGQEGLLYLQWQNNPQLDLSASWALNGGLLGYDLQTKIKAFDTGGQQAYSYHYMLGLSFRLNPDSNNCYGISFFRSAAGRGGGRPPDWVEDLPTSFQNLRGTNVYLVLWYRSGGTFQLINHRRLTTADGLVEIRDGTQELKDYSTMLLQLREEYTGGTNRINRISAYIAGTNRYPLWGSGSVTNAIWQDNTNVFPGAVVWNSGVITNSDSRYTTGNFLTQRPAEVGVHVFYDQSGANKKFFDDFAFRVEGGDPSQLGGEVVY